MRTTSGACAWRPGTAPTTSWSSGIRASATYDGLIEGTPQGMGGVPITRKQVRAQRQRAEPASRRRWAAPSTTTPMSRALRGRTWPSCSAEEGVAGAHQDPSVQRPLPRHQHACAPSWTRASASRIMAHGPGCCRLTARTTPTPPRGRRGRSCPS